MSSIPTTPKRRPLNQSAPASPQPTAFSQQMIVAWRPLITPTIAIVLLFLTSFVVIFFGLLFYAKTYSLPMVSARYDDQCEGKTQCSIEINITETFSGTVFMHYQLTNYFQNHRRYLYSRSDSQLQGEYEDYDGMSTCGDFISLDGNTSKENWLLPCGAVALSVFNDTFVFTNTSVASFSDVGISWRSDKDKLFKRLSPEYSSGIKWLDNNPSIFPNGQKNEHFIVWMRTASLPTFLKPYSRCLDCTIPPGNYIIDIANNYPVSIFEGEKYVVISQVNQFGGRNPYLSISYIIVGSILFIFAIVILLSQIYCPRKLGDTSYLRK